MSLQDLEALSKLPAREVLLAQLLGVMNGVPTALVSVLAAVIRGLLNVLVALKDQKAESEPAGGCGARGPGGPGGPGSSGGGGAGSRARDRGLRAGARALPKKKGIVGPLICIDLDSTEEFYK